MSVTFEVESGPILNFVVKCAAGELHDGSQFACDEAALKESALQGRVGRVVCQVGPSR